MRNGYLRTMSGGEPSSIKRDHPCAARTPVPQLYTGEYFYCKGGLRMYQALYRKWRPKTFADVVGQEHITETLQRQVAEGRLSHAYLFTGTRGTGKTTCAKILARAVNCEGICPRGQLRASGKRQPLQPLPELPWHRERAAARRGRAGRGVEQRRGQRARAA